MNLIFEVILDMFRDIGYFLKHNIRYFANVVEFTLPYAMFYVGTRDGVEFVPMMVIPAVAFLGIHILRSCADKLGMGNRIPPIPGKRFTQVDDDGEVNIENSRLQELILYMADYEDWLERKGFL